MLIYLCVLFSLDLILTRINTMKEKLWKISVCQTFAFAVCVCLKKTCRGNKLL